MPPTVKKDQVLHNSIYHDDEVAAMQFNNSGTKKLVVQGMRYEKISRYDFEARCAGADALYDDQDKREGACGGADWERGARALNNSCTTEKGFQMHTRIQMKDDNASSIQGGEDHEGEQCSDVNPLAVGILDEYNQTMNLSRSGLRLKQECKTNTIQVEDYRSRCEQIRDGEEAMRQMELMNRSQESAPKIKMIEEIQPPSILPTLKNNHKRNNQKQARRPLKAKPPVQMDDD